MFEYIIEQLRKNWSLNFSKSCLYRLIDFIKIFFGQGSAFIYLTTCRECVPQSSECDASLLQISVLMGEPYFSTSLLPWHSLFFWYCRTALAGLLRPDAAILPRSATLHMAAVEFQVTQIQIFSNCSCQPVTFENKA